MPECRAMPAMISLPFITIFIVHALLVTCTKDTLDLRRSDSNGTDIILAGAQNTSHPILLSSDGAYAWQFFSSNGDLTKRLLVVLRVLFNTSIVVWIANRDHPASPDASLLLELPLRRLTLRERNGAVVWSPAAVNISSIVMNTNGSLHILGEAGALQWQSFDEPADVLVPGQYLLTNHTATSSISVTDWTTGFYTLKADPGGMVLYATFDAQQTMIPYQIFNYIRENDTIASSLYSNCNHTIIIYDKDGSGITLEQSGTVTPQCLAENNGVPTINGVFFPNRIGNDSGYRFLRISPIGDLVTFYISNFTGLVQDNELFRVFYNTYCKFPSYCGAYGLCSSIQNCSCPQLFEAIDPSDPTQGCQRQTPLNCSNFEHHQFLRVPGTDYYANDYLTPQKVVQDPTECTNLCLQSCSCSAAFYNNNTGACHLYDQLRTMQYLANPNVVAFLRVTSLPGAGQNDKMVIRNQAIIGLTIGLFFLALIMVGVATWLLKRVIKGSQNEESDSEEEAFLEGLPGLPPRFSLKELHEATEGFSKQLGAGASGTVYEGYVDVLSTDSKTHENSKQPLTKVAVKDMKFTKHTKAATVSKRFFRAEVATLGNLNHVNLVQLRGFCAEGTHRLLIYEFMENGSLDKWIFSDDRGYNLLPWEVRYQIAIDTARGLAFLHEESRNKIVHLDVKPQNILLDSGFRAKLADFGLSKLLDNGVSHTMTAVRGTPGYMAPELILNLPITEKSDVFSYGIVLLELVGGRKNFNARVGTSKEEYLPAWALKQAQVGEIENVIDHQILTELKDQGERANALFKLESIINLAFWCIQEDASCRPSMTTVLLMLEEHLEIPDPPLDMVYVLYRRQVDDLPSLPNSSSSIYSMGAPVSVQ